MLGRARGPTPPRALGWSKSRQPHGVGRARGATPPCVRGSSENRQRRGVGSRFLLFSCNSDVITRPRRSARSGPGHCFRRRRPASSPVSISFFRKGRGRAEPRAGPHPSALRQAKRARSQVSARVRLPAQRFVPDSPLEGRGFEPSVPLFSYSPLTISGSPLIVSVTLPPTLRQNGNHNPFATGRPTVRIHRTLGPRPRRAQLSRPAAGSPARDRGSRADAAVRPAFSCSACHSMEPIAHTVLTGSGLRCSSSSCARWR